MQMLYKVVQKRSVNTVEKRVTFFEEDREKLAQFVQDQTQQLVALRDQRLFSSKDTRIPKGIIQQLNLDPELVDGRKTAARLFVLIASVQPLSVFVYNHGLEYIALDKFDVNNITDAAYFPMKDPDQNRDSDDNEVVRVRGLSEQKLKACTAAVNNIIQQAESEIFKFHQKHKNGHQFALLAFDFEFSQSQPKPALIKVVSTPDFSVFDYRNQAAIQAKVGFLVAALNTVGIQDFDNKITKSTDRPQIVKPKR